MDEWTDIDTVIAHCMADPVMRPRIIAARKTLAPILYPEGGENYERLMRGEGPKSVPRGGSDG